MFLLQVCAWYPGQVSTAFALLSFTGLATAGRPRYRSAVFAAGAWPRAQTRPDTVLQSKVSASNHATTPLALAPPVDITSGARGKFAYLVRALNDVHNAYLVSDFRLEIVKGSNANFPRAPDVMSTGVATVRASVTFVTDRSTL